MDINRVEIRLLIGLDALLAERNVTRAARRIHLSQPATSSLLARLRELFRDPLLVRSGRELVPTERALALVEPVQRLLADIGHLIEPPLPFDPETAKRSFVIAATDYVGLALFPRLVDLLRVAAPRIRVGLTAHNSSSVARQLESGEHDLAVANSTLIPGALRSRALFDERLVCVARKNHPKIRGRITLDQFCSLDHVVVSPRGVFTTVTDGLLEDMGRERKVKFWVQHFSLVPELVSKTDMVAIYPARLATRFGGRLQILAPPIPLPNFTLTMAWHERAHRDSGSEWLREMMVQCARSAVRRTVHPAAA